MAIKLSMWSDEQASKEVDKRFGAAAAARKKLEDQWSRNEAAVYGNSFSGSATVMDSLGTDPALDGDFDGAGPIDISVAYTFKNIRFIHSQLSSNPPTVAMRPTSSDQEDVRKADAADRTSRYMLRQYQMQENIDIYTLNALLYGTSALKTTWDSTKGDIVEYDEESGEMLMEGDISVDIPHTRNLYIDPDARRINQIKWIIELLFLDYDTACVRWPEHTDALKAARIERTDLTKDGNGEHYNSVELLEYWETGLPSNGYMGRYCIKLRNGKILEKCRPSPFRFPRAGTIAKIANDPKLPEEVKATRIAKLPQMARLPYTILTDIDVVNSIWGKSTVEYAAPLQDVLTEIDSSYIDNVRANGVARMVIPDTADTNIDVSNSAWDVVKVSGNQAPYFMEVPSLMPEMASSRHNMISGINDVMGTNESMFGQQSREQSGQSMQYATNQGNMIRRRLFNKYVLSVETIYKNMLDLARKHWSIDRTISVLGKEKAFEALSLKGADIDGGYDVVGEYGVTLSLDPITRRQEIMQLQPMFEKAGVPTRMSLKMMKLNELEGMYDKLQMAEDRQREIFEEMMATQQLIPPQEMMDHDNMIAWALDYFMSAEFKYMPVGDQALCREHIKQRIQMAAQEKSGGLSGQLQPPGPAGAPGPAPAGAVPGPAMAPG